MSHPYEMHLAVALKTNKLDMRIIPGNRQEFVGDGHNLPTIQRPMLTVVKNQDEKPQVSNPFTREKKKELALTSDYFLG